MQANLAAMDSVGMGMDASHCRGRHLIPEGVDLIYGKLSL
jgi:hypothetical protein